jgi:hypothetical protein
LKVLHRPSEATVKSGWVQYQEIQTVLVLDMPNSLRCFPLKLGGWRRIIPEVINVDHGLRANGIESNRRNTDQISCRVKLLTSASTSGNKTSV